MEIGSEMPKVSFKIKIITSILSGTFYAGSLYLLNDYFDEPIYNPTTLAIQGVAFGLFIGFGFPLLMKKYGKKSIHAAGKTIEIELSENETIEYEGPANLFRGVESVGGKLFLTNKKAIFKSHKLNIQTGQTDIDYSSIVEIVSRKTIGIVDNGIRIKTNDGKEFDFVVNDRENWLEKLGEKIA
ncbi:GRAM domain-containing protein [Flavobacterium tegetincola]|uniref:GRAM domain-containing protein n=1 Tax=Flavobacterium tegetincola TaxID=150172 RepID=UPI000409161A|nr:GRAM domain-containing protein [Flavobacterium tegetincola]